MKINICDPCKTLDGKITETNRVIRVPKRRHLNIDVCQAHALEVKKLSIVDYVKYAYKVTLGINLTESDSEIKAKFL